jgi:hypothetical protein
MVHQQCDKARYVRFQAPQQRQLRLVQPRRRVKFFPEVGDAPPLRARKKRLPHCRAQLDAQPWRRRRVVKVDAKYERAWQADDAHEPECGPDPDARD